MPVSFLLFLFAVPLLILVIPEYMREERLADLILNATNPVDMKHWGREIKAGEWPKMKAMALVNMEKVCCDVFVLHCVIVVVFQYKQNPLLKEALFKTAGSTLVECSLYDRYYGIGLTLHDLAINTPSQWKGENQLG